MFWMYYLNLCSIHRVDLFCFCPTTHSHVSERFEYLPAVRLCAAVLDLVEELGVEEEVGVEEELAEAEHVLGAVVMVVCHERSGRLSVAMLGDLRTDHLPDF